MLFFSFVFLILPARTKKLIDPRREFAWHYYGATELLFRRISLSSQLRRMLLFSGLLSNRKSYPLRGISLPIR